MNPEDAGLTRQARAPIALASACAAVLAAFPAQARNDPSMQYKIRSALTSPVHLRAQAETAWKRISSLPKAQQGKASLKSLVLKSAGGRVTLKNLSSRGKFKGQVQKLLRKAEMSPRGFNDVAGALTGSLVLSIPLGIGAHLLGPAYGLTPDMTTVATLAVAAGLPIVAAIAEARSKPDLFSSKSQSPRAAVYDPGGYGFE